MGTGNDLTLGFAYNPAGQIVSNTRSNDGYSFTGHANVNAASTINGLNQVTATGGTGVTYSDGRGNVTAIGGAGYGYDSENRMISAPGGVTLSYDPLGRLYQLTSGATTTRFLHDPGSGSGAGGMTLIAEYNASNVLQRRFVHGPGMDQPLVWYEGAGTGARRWFHADERGSVVAVSDATGNLHGTRNRYDEYGVPQGTLTGRFGYTGQAWLPEISMSYYRARIYNPGLGRFMQTDPVGYGSGMNLYAYVLNDPVNLVDPSGGTCVAGGVEIEVCGTRFSEWDWHNAAVNRIDLSNFMIRALSGGNIGEPGRDGEGKPFCNEPGVDQDDCAPVVEASTLPATATSLIPTSVQLVSVSARGPHRCTAVSDAPGGADFRNACRVHDACYQTLGMPKASCDSLFFRDLLAACERAPNYATCIFYAHAYYRTVESLGGPAYMYEQGRTLIRRFGL